MTSLQCILTDETPLWAVVYHDPDGHLDEADLWFDRLDALADFSHWADLPFWLPSEAAALSLGKDPKVVVSDNLEATWRYCALARRFCDRRDLIRRTVAVGQLEKRITPRAFRTWARKIGLQLPADLEEAIDKKEAVEQANVGVLDADKGVLTGLALSSVATFIFFLLERAYKGGNPSAGRIFNDMASAGFRLSEDTIFKILEKLRPYVKRISE